MIEAKTNKPRRFYFLPSTQNLGLNGTLTLAIYDDAGVQITGSPFAGTLMTTPSSLGTLGVYQTAEVTFPQAGTYYYVWQASGIKVAGNVDVLDEPIGDFSTGIPRKVRHATPNYQAVVDLVLKIYDTNGVLIETQNTLASQIAGVYETDDDVVLTTAGTYLFVWTSVVGGYAFAAVETILVLPAADLRAITFYVIDTAQSPPVPQVNVEVLLSKTDGTPLMNRLTNSAGKAKLSARNGSYVISIRKNPYTFSKNNLSVTIATPTLSDTNTFYLYASPFSASFDIEPLIDVSDKSLMVVYLADAVGRPLAFTNILITNLSVPDVLTGVGGVKIGVMGVPVTLMTDARGYAEAYLLRGQKVMVAIEGISVRRSFTVPNASTFNLMDQLTGANDPFDVIQTTVQAAVRTTL